MPRAAPGQRFGGRQKGTPNRNKQELMARIEALYPGYHPVVAMAAIANDEGADPKMRFDAHKEVAQYVTPKLKSIEHKGDGGGPLQVTVVRFTKDE